MRVLFKSSSWDFFFWIKYNQSITGLPFLKWTIMIYHGSKWSAKTSVVTSVFSGTQKCVRQHAAYKHSAAAVFFSLGTGAEQRQDRNTSLLVSASLSHSLPRQEKQSHIHVLRLSPLRPRWNRARLRLVPAEGSRKICHSALCTVIDFSSPLSSNSDHRPLLLAVSNHNPAVWFIHSQSVISVKRST